MKRCLIFAGGDFSAFAELERILSEEAVFVICADSGQQYAEALGISIDCVLGDFDSVRNAPHGKEILSYPPEKDDTDTMLAVKYALSRGFRKIDIAGGLGGRFDHAFANVQTLRYLAEHNAEGRLLDEQNEIMVQTAHTKKSYPARNGWYFSLLSLDAISEDVTIEGTKYPLEHGVLTANTPLGVSNEILAEEAIVSVGNGCLLVLYTRDKRA